jgi:hypothetical protein
MASQGNFVGFFSLSASRSTWFLRQVSATNAAKKWSEPGWVDPKAKARTLVSASRRKVTQRIAYVNVKHGLKHPQIR